MDGLAGNLKDGVRVIHPHHVLSMSRERALELLRDHGDEQDRHDAKMMLAGPVLTEADMRNLQYSIPMPSALTIAMWFARNPKLKRMACVA